jgi:hypothetical protein
MDCLSRPRFDQPQTRIGPGYEKIHLQPLLVAEVVQFFPPSLIELAFEYLCGDDGGEMPHGLQKNMRQLSGHIPHLSILSC